MNTNKFPRILRLNQVIQAIGLSRASIYRLMDRGLFPKPIKIGISAVGWPSEALDSWLTERKLATIH